MPNSKTPYLEISILTFNEEWTELNKKTLTKVILDKKNREDLIRNIVVHKPANLNLTWVSPENENKKSIWKILYTLDNFDPDKKDNKIQ